MRQAASEIILNVLKNNFPQSPDSTIIRLAEKLQRQFGAKQLGRQTASAEKGEEDLTTTVLFVDDSLELVRTATRYMNEIRPQWRFLLAHSLAEARRIYDLNVPHAAVLDVSLPDGSGLDLLSEFKRSRPELPVIIISGDDPVIINQAVIERGGAAFLPKPFSVPVLVGHIEAAIAAGREEAAGQAGQNRSGGWKDQYALALRSEPQSIAFIDPEDGELKRFLLK